MNAHLFLKVAGDVFGSHLRLDAYNPAANFGKKITLLAEFHDPNKSRSVYKTAEVLLTPEMTCTAAIDPISIYVPSMVRSIFNAMTDDVKDIHYLRAHFWSRLLFLFAPNRPI
jgi:hypothetical protein